MGAPPPYGSFPGERASEWRRIESAPRDETPILAFIPADEVDAAQQHVVRFRDGEWQLVGYEAFRYEPSHWQPLPAGP
jgi:hypothetical protein